MWVFVNAAIVNPSFDSQTKETLTLKASKFGSSFELSEKFLKDFMKTGIVDHCLKYAKAREELKIKKELNTGVKKNSKILGIPKLEDANNAGTRQSEQCTLILTEGDSAKSLAMAGIEIVGRDTYGCFPLKGKLLNVREAKGSQLLNNEEIQNIIKILGIQVGKNYEDVRSLRYGSIMIMTDSDTDGSHIKGLIINFIHHFWPSLIKINGFLKEFITPIIKVSKGNRNYSFYTIPEYKNWYESINKNVSGWKIKYYKGLGTSTDKEAQEYFADIERNKIEFEYEDQEDDEAIELAFVKKKADARKQWLGEFDYSNALQDVNFTKIRYTDFINKEFILYSISDNQRSIPCLCDGLKPSERKILFSCFKRKLKQEIKVAQLCGYIAEHSAYHHGEMSLQTTIVAMAQNYVGSNNINLLMPIGQFGTRNQGGKDHASARYIFTSLNKVTRHLFNENDDELMKFIVEEGQKIEPNWYLPIVPMILVNGADGIGTGWSTSVPCFNPREIVENIRNKINKNEFVEMKPWYKGYTGTITKNNKGVYENRGVWKWKEDEPNTLVITELPIKKWTKDYKIYLEKLMGHEHETKPKAGKKPKKKTKNENNDEEESVSVKEEVIVDEVKEYHTNNRVHFEIRLNEHGVELYRNATEDKIIEKFKLKTTINTSNMVLFDSNLKIKKYQNVQAILEEFYPLRLKYYTHRKNYLLTILRRDLEILSNKARFIQAVVDEKIKVRNVKKKDIITVLVREGILFINKIKIGFMKMSEINKIKFRLHEDLEAELITKVKDKEEEEKKQESDGVSDAESEVKKFIIKILGRRSKSCTC